MHVPILATKLYLPPPRPNIVPRPRLHEKLNEGLHRKLTLISAPAGFGKTTLLASWIAAGQQPAAWLSLDEGDGEPARFLAYLVAALQQIAPEIGSSVLSSLQSPQPPPTETVLTTLLNDVAACPEPFILVLDDYHVVDAQPVDQAVAFLLEHQPPHMHLAITTREDPNLPLARLRVRGQLTELRANDLRFTRDEAAAFLKQVMGLELSKANVAALEARTEGWIAGLQMAALSMQGQKDIAHFIQSFTGSHRFVLDYLIEEVLNQQSERIQEFLLQTAVLNQLTGSLCNAVTGQTDGQEILEALERANLFIVPLDNERRWYRYHHLFTDLLRQRLEQTSSESDLAALHVRASEWFEANGRDLEAFQHAAAANDIPRASRLIAGKGMPLPFRGALAPVMHWLAALPPDILAADPALLVTQAMTTTMAGRATADIPTQLQTAEALLPTDAEDPPTRDLLGQIAAIRAMLAVPGNQAETILAQSRRALAYLHPENAPVRTLATWTLGYAYQVRGDRQAARQAYREAAAAARGSGNLIVTLAALTNLGQVQESELQPHQAAETYAELMEMADKLPWMMAYLPVVLLGLGRIHYQWNELTVVETYCRQARELVGELENVDTPAAAGILLARLRLAQNDLPAAQALLAETEQFIRDQQFGHWVGELTEVRIEVVLKAGDHAAAAQLAQERPSPRNQARVALAQRDPAAALAVLESARQEAEAKGWADKLLALLVLTALAHWQQGDGETAVHHLQEAVALAKPGGLIRAFVDEGAMMAHLLYEALARGIEPAYMRQLLAAFPTDGPETALSSTPQAVEADFIEPLSERELEVLQLIAEGLTNQEVANRLYLSLHTVKVHARNIYSKLGVKNRTQAVAKGRALGLLSPI